MVKSWLVQDQTVLGKDYSNLLIADSLLKTIWFINAPCYDNEALFGTHIADMEAGEKAALMKKAYSTLILCLGDRVLWEVTKETSAAGI
ncbi:hypothetical protein Tco_0469257 [Tanacetum coccineum]